MAARPLTARAAFSIVPSGMRGSTFQGVRGVGRLMVAGLALTAVCNGAERTITLEEAVETALKQNRDLRLLQLNLESRDLAVGMARTEFSVRLQPLGGIASDQDGGQTEAGFLLSKRQEWGLTASAEGRWFSDTYPDGSSVRRATVRVEIRQPLLRRFGRLVNEEPVTQARRNREAAQREIELKRTDLVVQVVENYEELLRLQRQLQFDLQALQRYEQLLRLTEARERQGRATRVDVLRVDQQRGEVQIRLNKTREQLDSKRADFANVLGCDPGEVLVVREAPLLMIDPPGRREALEVARANRLDYAQVLADCQDAERGIRIARRNLLPDLEWAARYERTGQGARSEEALDLNRETWFVGLSAATDVRRQRERWAFRQALVTGESARQTVEIMEAVLSRQVQQVLGAYERARGEVLFAQRNYHLAEGRARLARRMFEMGKGDNFTVTDAENALLDAQNRMLLSQAEASIAAYRVLRALGTLLEAPEELKPRAAGAAEGGS